MKIQTADALYPALQKLLGLPDHVIAFDLHVRAGGIVTVDCKYHPVADDGRIAALGAVFAGYELVPRAIDNFGNVEIMTRAKRTEANQDFDAWMRTRTDSAHAAYMAQHSAGGQAYQP
ncbi:MAG TPA: hypothetical protein VF800_02610 [Telluria sp.]|jgi:hypothetical protein